MRFRTCLATLTLAFGALGSGMHQVHASGNYTNAVLGLNPASYYTMDVDAAVGSAVDYGYLSNVGTIEGNFPPADLNFPGPAVPGFDGANKAFYANNAGSIGLGPGIVYATDQMSVAFWAKQPDNVEGGDRIFTNNIERLAGGTADAFQVVFGVGGGGGLVVATGQEADMQLHLPPSVFNTKDDQWHHIVISRNGDNVNDILMVVDGVDYSALGALVPTSATWGVEPPSARIASRNVAPVGQTMNGAIDEVAVWLDRSLTVGEAQSLWRASQIVPEPSSFGAGLLGLLGLIRMVRGRRSGS